MQGMYIGDHRRQCHENKRTIMVGKMSSTAKSVKIRHKEVEVIDCCIYTEDQTLKSQKTFSIIKYKDLQNKILNKNCQILQKWLLLIPVYNFKKINKISSFQP